MIPPAVLEGMPENIEKQFRLLEERTMADVVRRLKNNGNDVIRSADWQIHRLQELGKSRDEIKKYIQDALDVSESEVDSIFEKAAEQSYVYDQNDYGGTSELVPFEENGELQQLTEAIRRQTSEEFQNITRSMGFAVKQPDGTVKFNKIADYYQQTLDGAMLDIASGNFDYNTVLKRIVSEMTNSGLRTVDYASGHSNRIDAAARRAVMTGVSQLTGKINEANAEALETDMYEVSWHSGARPSHMEWQGKWFTKAELESVCGLGSVTGLCGANCYHSYSPVIPGISKPTYTAEELTQMNAEEMKQTEYGDKKYTKYEALQRQRKLETTMRAQRQKIKLLEDGGANEDDIITARCRYRATSAEYTRFSKAMNLPQQRERVYIDDLGNVGAGKYTKTQPYFAQYRRYKERLGDAAPSSYDEFEKLKFSKSKEWENIQLQYRYKGIDDRLLSHTPAYQALRMTDGVPDVYNDCARAIDERSKEVIFKYTDGGSGCAEINTFAATGNATTAASAQDVQDLHDALAQMSLPQNTVVFRGTKRAYIEGLEYIQSKYPISEWGEKSVKIHSFASTSVFRDTMYEGEVEMTILVPKGKKGAGYVNEISHHHLTEGFEDEYEVVLQNNSEYGIIEAQYYKDKLFLVVEWLGG